MKKMINIILILCMLMGLAGCGAAAGEPAGKTAVGFVVANTACSQGLNLSSPLVQDTVLDTILRYGWITVVNADGDPAVVANQNFDIDEKYKSASAERLKMDARSKSTNFLAGMGRVIADSEEVDYLKSIQLCARSLSSLEDYDSKVMIVLGTGLSTAGVLNFQNNLLMAEPEAIADALAAQGEIPSLEGIEVYWQQLGDTALPQAAMNGQHRQALKEIWRAIIERGGGEVVFDDMVYKPVSASAAYPQVSVVALPAAPTIRFDAASLEETEVPFQEPVRLSEEQIRFVGDSAAYVDAAAAKAILAPIAEILIANPDVSILLCGCIAGDETSDFGLNLSRQRAEAVKQTLMELSVPEEQMIVLGLGTNNPWHISGVGFEGELAAQNRKVVLLNTESALARELLHP